MRPKHADPFRSRTAWLRYGAAVAAAFLAALLRFAVGPAGQAAPYLSFFAVVILIAWYGGFGAGVVTTALSAVLAVYFFLHRPFSLQVDDWRGALPVSLLSSLLHMLLHPPPP